MIIEKKKISDLKPAPYNPRKSNEKQEANLKKSLEKFGVVEPIVFNKQTGHIVGGHFRIRELKKLGYKEVDCVIVDLNEDDEKELNIRLNANTGEWDWDTLANEWNVEELSEWGVDLPAFELKLKDIEEDGYEEPDNIETDIQYGDLFKIGNHFLLCGDAFNSDDCKKLMQKNKANCVITDPPYGIDFNYSNTLLFSENSHVFIFNNDRAIVRQLKESPLEFKKFFVFNHSGCAIPQEGGNECFLDHILISHEINGKPKLRFNRGDGLRTVIRGEYRRSKNHKHEKPASLLSDLLKGYSNEGSIVLDFFAGGGSLMSACQQLERICYCMELEPKNCQIIIDRMEKCYNIKSIKIN